MIARILRGVGRRLGISVYVVKTRPLSTERPVPRQDVEFRELTAHECLEASSDPALDLPEHAVRDATARGDVCVGAFDSGRVVGYAWFASDTTAHLDGVWIDFDKDAIYICKAFVRPESRGRHIAPALYLFADRLFVGRGRTSAIIAMEATNRASIRAAERSGTRAAGFAVYWNAGPVFMSFSSSGAKRIGFRFYRPTRTPSTQLD
jgi:ribosomal protein S18 acetylase RimI-like enzyme